MRCLHWGMACFQAAVKIWTVWLTSWDWIPLPSHHCAWFPHRQPFGKEWLFLDSLRSTHNHVPKGIPKYQQKKPALFKKDRQIIRKKKEWKFHYGSLENWSYAFTLEEFSEISSGCQRASPVLCHQVRCAALRQRDVMETITKLQHSQHWLIICTDKKTYSSII